jgi:hypothetical protein
MAAALFAHPVAGWIAIGAMWIWHWPTLCNAAVASRSVYALQTSLLVLGILDAGHRTEGRTAFAAWSGPLSLQRLCHL